MKTFALFALLASVGLASPAPAPVAGVILHERSGYLVKAELIQHYSKLCKMFPMIGDKPGDGVFVIDEGLFHLEPKNYSDYVTMLGLEQRARQSASEPVKSSDQAAPTGFAAE